MTGLPSITGQMGMSSSAGPARFVRPPACTAGEVGSLPPQQPGFGSVVSLMAVHPPWGVGQYVPTEVKPRSRRLLPTTKTLENAVAAPASMGLSMPRAAIGIAVVL